MIHFSGNRVIYFSAFQIIIRIKLSVNPSVTIAGELTMLCILSFLSLLLSPDSTQAFLRYHLKSFSVTFPNQNFPVITADKQITLVCCGGRD